MRCKEVRAIAAYVLLDRAGFGALANDYDETQLARIQSRVGRFIRSNGSYIAPHPRIFDPAIQK